MLTVKEYIGRRLMEQNLPAGRAEWTETDIASLMNDGRAAAVIVFQRKNFPKNIARTSEAFELWLGRAETTDDFDGSVFRPSKTGLTRHAFIEMWRELGRRFDVGEFQPPGDVLDRYPDIRDYVPRSFRGEGK